MSTPQLPLIRTSDRFACKINKFSKGPQLFIAPCSCRFVMSPDINLEPPYNKIN